MRGFLIILFFCYASSHPQIPSLSSIQLVKFPNAACTGTTRRIGTCYTNEECSERSGTADGSCADGYGVCCTVSIPCGGASRENNSFMILAQTTRPADSVCTHRILPLNNMICRIRLDFTRFDIAGPVTGTTVGAGDAVPAAELTRGGAIGTCARDTFSVSSPGNLATPIICGINTGQHLFVDAITSGNVATFSYNDDEIPRSYDIRVIQYECGDTQGGPSDCLQYFTGPTGTVASFNFPMGTAVVGAQVTHLTNQHYQVCFRRESGRCTICYMPSVTVAGTAANVPAKQSSYGVSVATAATPAQSTNDPAKCTTDYLTIPFAFRSDQALFATKIPIYDNGPAGKDDAPTDLKYRFCGRIFAADENQQADNVYAANGANAVSVCSVARPFKMNVDFNVDENTGTASTDNAQTNELSLAPGGIVGFSLDFTQLACGAAAGK